MSPDDKSIDKEIEELFATEVRTENSKKDRGAKKRHLAEGDLPEGFKELVNLVLEQDAMEFVEVPRSMEHVWDNLTYCVLLGGEKGQTTEAEIAYVYNDVLCDVFERNTIKRKGWIENAKNKISDAIGSVTEPAKNLKLKILNEMEREIESTHKTLVEMDQFLSAYPITTKYLKEIANDKMRTTNLIADIVYQNSKWKIQGMGYTRTILWLQSCGIASDFCPPNNAIRGFLSDECGYETLRKSFRYPNKYGVKFQDDLDIIDKYDILFRICGALEKIKKQISPKLSREPAIGDVGKAIWWYRTTRRLVSRKKVGKKFSPRALVDFLKNQKWDFDKLGEYLSDIEKVPILEEKLTNFLAYEYR